MKTWTLVLLMVLSGAVGFGFIRHRAAIEADVELKQKDTIELLQVEVSKLHEDIAALTNERDALGSDLHSQRIEIESLRSKLASEQQKRVEATPAPRLEEPARPPAPPVGFEPEPQVIPKAVKAETKAPKRITPGPKKRVAELSDKSKRQNERETINVIDDPNDPLDFSRPWVSPGGLEYQADE